MTKAAPPDPRDSLPLSPQVFQVLLSLSDGPLHGYAIITDIGARTEGEMRLTASTLYDALARLLDQALIEEVDSGDSRRRSYRLTRLGRDVAEAEAHRLERLIAMARDKRLLAGRGRR
jgi:DNA-binding PadR family transcriptional regulator